MAPVLPRLFFVLGAAKSGTTWLQRIIDAHPNVCCYPEGAFHMFWKELEGAVGRYNQALEKRPAAGFPQMQPSELRLMFRNFIVMRLRSNAPKEKHLIRIGEKDPDHASRCGMMMDMFPNASFIHIVRDGRDQAISNWFHLQRRHPVAFAKRQSDFGQYLIKNARLWRDLIQMIKTEQKRTGVSYHELRYESLIEHPNETAATVFDFLGVDSNATTIAHCLECSTFRKLSGGREAGQEDRSSFFRKGIIGDWRNHMDDNLSADFVREAGGVMQELGYA